MVQTSQITQLAVLATIATLAQCQPSANAYERALAGIYAREALAADDDAQFQAWDKTLKNEIAADEKADPNLAPKPKTQDKKPAAPKAAAPKLRRFADPYDAYLAERDLYEREAYPEAYPEAYAMPYASDFEFNQYANGLSARDLYARDAYAEAYPEAYPEAYFEADEEYGLYARDAYPEAEPEADIHDILARDPEHLTERDIDVLFASLNERDLHEIIARFAEPEVEEHELFARDAEPEDYEFFERDAEPEYELYERDAEPEDYELFERDAEADADADGTLAQSGFISKVRSILGMPTEA
ncbi:hypothetical protein MMC13_008507 [Lambiella insularis]|nr:hypothetical protein [Lambiella insularis]